MLAALWMAAALAAPAPEVLAAWVGEAPGVVVPLLEEVTGRTLEALPRIRYVPRGVLLAAERDRALPYFQEANPGADPEAILRAVEAYVNGAGAYVAAYDYEGGVLYVVHENLAAALDFAPLPTEAATRAAVECVVAHELTHALQGQEAGDPPWFGTDGALEASVAREGHAIAVGAEVCRRRGERAAAAWHLLVQGALGLRDEAERDLMYRQSARYAARTLAEGGSEAGWALVASPPPVAVVTEAIRSEEARWAGQGSAVEAVARPWGACLVRREWRPEELRVVRPKVLAPPQEAIADVRWLSWCGVEGGGAVGHAIVDPEHAEAVIALLRLRFDLGGDTREDLDVRGADQATRYCDDAGCTTFLRQRDRLAIVALDAPARRTLRAARRLLR